MSRYTKDDIFRMVEEEDVEFIRLQFTDRKSTRQNSSHGVQSRMPSSA